MLIRSMRGVRRKIIPGLVLCFAGVLGACSQAAVEEDAMRDFTLRYLLRVEEESTTTGVCDLSRDELIQSANWNEVQTELQTQRDLGGGTASITTIATGIGGAGKYLGGVLAPNGKIYGISRAATQVLVIDPATDALSTFASPGGGTWAAGVLAPNGKIYATSDTGTNVLVIDPETDTTTTLAGSGSQRRAVLAPNGKIYGVPLSTGGVQVIDPEANTTTTIAVGGTGWQGGVLAPNGKIYGIPSSTPTYW